MENIIGYAVAVALFLILAYCVFLMISTEIEHDKFMSQLLEILIVKKQRKSVPRFDVSKYHKRREKFLLEIEQERQTEPKYYVTLWFGLRGLKERVDGKYEWIYRTPQNPTCVWEPKFTPEQNKKLQAIKSGQSASYSGELSPAQLAVDRARAMARNADIPTFRPTGLANGNWSENCVQQVNAETFESFRNRQASQMVQSNQASIDDLRNLISNLQLQATQQELNQYVINSVCYPQYLRTNIYPVFQF